MEDKDDITKAEQSVADKTEAASKQTATEPNGEKINKPSSADVDLSLFEKESGSSGAESADNKKTDGKKSDKKDKNKADKGDRADKKKQSEDKRNEAKLKKEWEDSIVASKRVKREEIRRKVKQATVILLVFALVVTSVVYVMLLFTQENNVRITASSKNEDTSISLSMDNDIWTPYLNANGPESIWDISYNPVYNREKIDTVEEVREMLNASDVEIGDRNGEKFIRFVFMVKNTGKYETNLSYEMTLDYDKRGLQNAVRVMWGESRKSDDLSEEDSVSVDVYAARSRSRRLEGTNANYNVNAEDGFVEYVAYPWGSDDSSFSLLDYEKTFSNPDIFNQAVQNGYFAATPFLSDSYVFQRHSTLAQGDIMYCYVCIWIEGSDFDCVDSALGGYVKLGINFVAY